MGNASDADTVWGKDPPAIPYDYLLAERSRYVRLGRPEGWRPLSDGSIRVWLTDGAAFTYHPSDDTVSGDVAPIDGGAQ